VTGPATGSTDDGLSVGSLVSDVAADVKRLLHQEVRLARSEIRTEARKAARAGRLIATGTMALHLVVVLVSVGAVLAASEVLASRVPDLAGLAPAVAAAGVALVWVVVGRILLGAGRPRLRSISPIPRQTIQTLKEDIAWLRKPTA
jgi:Putative Actinobacterial Holin-X, holin superfamily III